MGEINRVPVLGEAESVNPEVLPAHIDPLEVDPWHGNVWPPPATAVPHALQATTGLHLDGDDHDHRTGN
ncbi:hypothetical protein ABTZ99_39840 [Actinosynnema sp. NPDC002837]